MRSNQSLGSRVAKGGLQVRYSPSDDLLSIYLHMAIKGVGGFLRDDDFHVTFYDEESMLIEGFEVLFFMQRLAEAPPQHDVWKMFAAYIEAGQSGMFSPPPEDLKKLGKGLQALLPAIA